MQTQVRNVIQVLHNFPFCVPPGAIFADLRNKPLMCSLSPMGLSRQTDRQEFFIHDKESQLHTLQ